MFAFFSVFYKRTEGSFWFHKSYKHCKLYKAKTDTTCSPSAAHYGSDTSCSTPSAAAEAAAGEK